MGNVVRPTLGKFEIANPYAFWQKVKIGERGKEVTETS